MNNYNYNLPEKTLSNAPQEDDRDADSLQALRESEASLSPHQRVFLQRFSDFGTVHATAKAIGVHFSTAFYWIKRNENFARCYELAKEAYTQKLELELYRRSLNANASKMSDVLLMFTLKARRPDIYREKSLIDKPIIGDITVKLAVPPYDEAMRLVGPEIKAIESTSPGTEGLPNPLPSAPETQPEPSQEASEAKEKEDYQI